MARLTCAILLLLCCGASGCSLFSGKTIATVTDSAASGHAAAGVAVSMATIAIGGDESKPDGKPVSDKCENCYGTGRSGDGLATCKVCKGTGKKQAKAEVDSVNAEPVSTQAPPPPVAVEVQWSQLPDDVAERLASTVEEKIQPRFDAIDVAIAGVLASQKCEPSPVRDIGKPYRRIEAYMMPIAKGQTKSSCLPCEAWKDNHQRPIIDAGWSVEMNDGLPGMTMPTFRVWVGNVYKDYVGILSLERLKSIETELLTRQQ